MVSQGLKAAGEVTLTGHAKTIQDIAWNCEGRKLATASSDMTARVWTVESHREGREVELKDHTQSVEGVHWHPTQCDTLASISQDKTLRIWDIRGKKSTAIATPEEIICVKYSPDGDYIAISDKQETVRLIDCRVNKVMATFTQPPSGWINELVWSRSGDAILLANGRTSNLEKGMMDVLRVDKAKDECKLALAHSVVAAAGNCMCIAADPTNKCFATGSYDGITSIWDNSDLVCIRPACVALEDSILSLDFSHDGVFLAGCSEIDRNSGQRRFIDICEVSNGGSAAQIDCKAIPKTLCFHPSTYTLAYGCEKMTVEDKDAGRYGDGRSASRTEVPVVVQTLTQA